MKIAILASGGGTNLQALMDAWRSGQFKQAEIVVAGSDRNNAGALRRAAAAGIPTFVLEPSEFPDRLAYDEELARRFDQLGIDLICLAGYLRVISPPLVRRYAQRILNIHPALLPAFGGAGMYGHHVHAAVLASGAKYSGCSVHFVDEGTDTGPIVLQSTVPVLDNDTPETLAERVLNEEHRVYPRAVALFCEGRLQVNGKRVQILEKA